MEPLHANRFPAIEGALAERWAKFPKGWDRPYFPTLVGLDDGRLAADGTLTYTVRPPRD